MASTNSLTPQQRQALDAMIGSSFDSVGAPPSYITPAYNPADYASIYAKPTTPAPTYQAGMTGRGLPLSASNRLPSGSAGIDPIGWKPPVVAANNGPAWNAPTSMDLAAIDARNGGMPGPSLDSLMTYTKGPSKPQTPALVAATNLANPKGNVTAALQPAKGGGLLDWLFGPSKNGMGGLLGLLGGKNAGGILGSTHQVAAPAKSGPIGVGTNGYTYVNGVNTGYSPAEQANREARGQAIGDANRKNPNPTYTVSGDNNAFQPASVQNSVRWQTGY